MAEHFGEHLDFTQEFPERAVRNAQLAIALSEVLDGNVFARAIYTGKKYRGPVFARSVEELDEVVQQQSEFIGQEFPGASVRFEEQGLEVWRERKHVAILHIDQALNIAFGKA